MFKEVLEKAEHEILYFKAYFFGLEYKYFYLFNTFNGSDMSVTVVECHSECHWHS